MVNLSLEENIVNSNLEEEMSQTSKRKYDIIVFGASGFTGQFVVMEMGFFSQIYNLTWAIAGRNTNKLQNVLDKMYKTQSGIEDKKIDIINADLNDIKSVMKMALSTSVIINCVGPYYIYGEVVVKSCVLCSTHYLDVTGESLFMEKMAFLYNSKAEENNSLIISALGMESVPADIGVEYLYNNFNGDLKNVDIYMKLYSISNAFPSSALIHEGTWISAILHLSTQKQRLYYRTLLDELMGINRVNPTILKILHKQNISIKKDKKKWCLAFPEPDQSVIVRSIHHAKTKDNLPYNFYARNYIVFGSLITAIIALLMFAILSFMVKFEPIRKLFIQFPKIFSFGIATKTGPNEKLMENGRMLLTLIGYGSVSIQSETNINEIKHGVKKTIVKFKAKNPGYGFTSKAIVLAAVTILRDNVIKRGVLTPAAAFRNTQYLNRLIEYDAATIEIESEQIIYKN
ncbi:Hypothetical protein CINCED_3A024175 [Cinara cedri]|nr:Hypothetical protein CINCED_3A024175 [Cinara cedri]